MPKKKVKKRANGEGSYTKVSGGWKYRVTVKDLHGTSRRISGTGKTQLEAKSLVDKKIEKLLDRGNEYTVAEYAEKYQRFCAEGHVTSSYLTKNIESAFRLHILPAFGTWNLGDVTTDDVQKWVDRLSHSEGYHSGELKKGESRKRSGKRLSQKTVRNILGIFSKMMKKAAGNHLIPCNPCEGVTVLDLQTPQEKLAKKDEENSHYLTKEQMSRFLEVVENDPYCDEILFAVYTGCRRAEIMGLTWDYVELDRIRIVLQLKREDGKPYYLGDTKSKRPRDIYRNELLDGILESARKKQEEYKTMAGESWRAQWNLVFTKPDGTCIPPDNLRKHVKKLGREIGCPWLTVKDLRSSFATLMVVEDVMGEKEVQKILGHVDIKTTEEHYVKAAELRGPKLAKKAENFFETLKDTPSEDDLETNAS